MQVRLKEIRKSRSMTQAQLAEKLGVKLPTYRTWERGTTMMNLEQAYNCAVILHCSIDEIAGMPPKPHTYADSRQERINAQYEAMNETGKQKTADHVNDIHANSDNRKSALQDDPIRISEAGVA